MQFPFGEFAPDAGEAMPGVLMVCNGAQPKALGYGPAKALAAPAQATALPDTCLGLGSLIKRDGTNVVYGFTGSDIYQMQADFSWSASLASGFACTAGDHWSIAQFGDKLLATNTTDGLQEYDIETGGTVDAVANAGKPRALFVCANVVVALDCLNDAGDRDNRLIRTSAIGNHREWKKTGSDKQPLEDGSALVGGVDLKNSTGLIFQRDMMRLIQFGTGSAGAFSLAKVSDGRGAVGRLSIIGLDGVVYWLSADGFKSFSLANGIQHIGAGRVDQWFFDRVSSGDLEKVQVSLDPYNKLVLWRYPSYQISSTTVFDDILAYSWQFNKWATWTDRSAYLSQIATPGYVLDAMEDFGPLDSITLRLDDRFWQGGAPVLAGLDANNKYATFSGANYAATFETGINNSPTTELVTWATPIDDSPDGTLAVGVRQRLSDPTDWKPGTAKTRTGRTPQRARGHNISFRREIPAGSEWQYAVGVDHVQPSTGGPK
jgi:hypothetical protein